MKPTSIRAACVAALWCAAALAARAQGGGLPPGAKLLQEGFKFPEGPAVDRSGVLYFSDTTDSKIYRWKDAKAEVFVADSGGANGLAFAADGALYGAAGAARALLKFNAKGEKSVALDKVGGAPLNAPNDLVIDAQGTIFMTNPVGMGGGARGGKSSVVRLRADGKADEIAREAAYPNGIEISPDGKFLYVDDLLAGCAVFRYPLSPDGEVGAAETWHKFGTGMLDGMAVAASGNVYVTLNAASKIAVLGPKGDVLKEIQFPKASQLSNLCFAGPDMKTLYITMGGVGAPGKLFTMPADEPGLKLACCR